MTVRVTAEDLETGDGSTIDIQPGNYCIIAVDPCRVVAEQHHANGTTVITLKGRSEHLMGMRDVAATDQGDAR